MKSPLFLSFEGIDGSGKSTQVKLLEEKLSSEGFKVYTTSEPTDSAIGSLIRKIFKGGMKADHRVIAGLFIADRLDHLLNENNGIVKKLEDGYTVITDRYYFSSYAYQGTHMPMDWVINANSMSTEILRPDLNIFIDVPVETCMKRLTGTRHTIELYETLENLNNVRSKYFEAFKLLRNKEEILITDGNRPAEEIGNDIWKEILKMIG